MEFEIRKLTPALAEDYVRFFDATPHDDHVDEHKCYCVCWCDDDYEGKDFSSREKRRDWAGRYVREGNIQGYLAYYGGNAVGWCNANTKSDCLKCCSWRMFMDYVPVGESGGDIKVKSVFCFTIAPEMKRKGLATKLLERVCEDAARDGFDFVEVYPKKVVADETINFGGPFEMYRRCGFTVYYEAEQGLVMRKKLKE
ncbi:MAG: GNAT family N-acetyltransferase [Oscillospiraceae bacterium]|nr:GNAT family N-acetyltransferase [Oscillospiraceae bacterium]